MEPATPSPLSVSTPGDKRSLPVECRFEDALKKELPEAMEGDKMKETLSEPEEEMEIGATPGEELVPGSFSPGTSRELLQDSSGEDLELKLGNEPSNLGMVFMSDEGREKNTLEGSERMFFEFVG